MSTFTVTTHYNLLSLDHNNLGILQGSEYVNFVSFTAWTPYLPPVTYLPVHCRGAPWDGQYRDSAVAIWIFRSFAIDPK